MVDTASGEKLPTEILKALADEKTIKRAFNVNFERVCLSRYLQKNYPQSKLVRVLSGSAFDVAIDLRRGSKTYGKWHAEFLSGQNKKQLYMPQGFGHAILILEEDTVFSYKANDIYHPDDEGGISFDDPFLNISWPIPLNEIILSEKDKALESMKEQGLI